MEPTRLRYNEGSDTWSPSGPSLCFISAGVLQGLQFIIPARSIKQGESENQDEKDNTCSLDDDIEGLEFLRQEQPMLCLKVSGIYGIDAASGSAVSTLNISPRDHVLDLCAAPGAKLCMILELLGNSSFVTGVDVATIGLWLVENLIRMIHLEAMEGKKKAIKEREKGSLQLISHKEDPEMIYYGRQSVVVGLSKSELFNTVSSHDNSRYGYDKVAGAYTRSLRGNHEEMCSSRQANEWAIDEKLPS
ncbi:bacterial Fmu (Sun)/eukaryotic nucleolar NOL1/Nop2p [Tanacetum coccineum]